MKLDPPTLEPIFEVNLNVENDGHNAMIEGNGRHFVAKFSTLSSLFHYARACWPLRRQLPAGFTFQVEWHGFRFPRQK